MFKIPLRSLGAAEVVILATLLLPVSPLNSLGISICGIAKDATWKVVCLTVATILFGIMCDGLYDSMRVGPLDSNTPDDFCSSIQTSLIAAQELETALLAGVDLTLGFVLIILSSLMEKLGKLEASHSALKKQAEGAQKAYMDLHEETENAKKGVEDSDFASAKSQLREAEDLCANLKKENEELLEKCKKAEADTAAMKKQAESNVRAYDDLMEENQSLSEQLNLSGKGAKKDS